MLESYACALTFYNDPVEVLRYASQAAELCILRYPYCRNTLLEYVNMQLESYGVGTVTGFSGIDELKSAIERRLVEGGEGLLYVKLDNTTLKGLKRLAAHIFVTAVAAVLDALGIYCPMKLLPPELTKQG